MSSSDKPLGVCDPSQCSSFVHVKDSLCSHTTTNTERDTHTAMQIEPSIDQIRLIRLVQPCGMKQLMDQLGFIDRLRCMISSSWGHRRKEFNIVEEDEKLAVVLV